MNLSSFVIICFCHCHVLPPRLYDESDSAHLYPAEHIWDTTKFTANQLISGVYAV